MCGCIGTVYGVSVGPGDPELMTVKAIKTLERCRVLAVPVTHKGNSLALEIVSELVGISEKELLTLPFPMTTDPATLRKNYALQAERIAQILADGEDVAFICLGDVSIYSTFAYIGDILREKGYPVRMIPGVTSFCASACALGVSLTAINQPLHIVPAGSKELSDVLRLPGAKVLMKSARQFSDVRSAVISSGQCAYATVDCGLESEKLYRNLADMPEDPGYFTTIIVKERP